MLSLTVCLLCKPTEWSSLERRRVRTVRRRRQKMTHLGNVAKDHCSSWFRRRIFKFKCVYSEIPVNHLDDLHPEGQNGLCELFLTNWTRWETLLLKYKRSSAVLFRELDLEVSTRKAQDMNMTQPVNPRQPSVFHKPVCDEICWCTGASWWPWSKNKAWKCNMITLYMLFFFV